MPYNWTNIPGPIGPGGFLLFAEYEADPVFSIIEFSVKVSETVTKTTVISDQIDPTVRVPASRSMTGTVTPEIQSESIA